MNAALLLMVKFEVGRYVLLSCTDTARDTVKALNALRDVRSSMQKPELGDWVCY